MFRQGDRKMAMMQEEEEQGRNLKGGVYPGGCWSTPPSTNISDACHINLEPHLHGAAPVMGAGGNHVGPSRQRLDP